MLVLSSVLVFEVTFLATHLQQARGVICEQSPSDRRHRSAGSVL